MTRIPTAHLLPLAICIIALAACQGGNDVPAAGQSTGAAKTVHTIPASAQGTRTSPATPAAPIEIAYEIMGTPVVGIPLSINVNVKSALDQPIRVNYRIIDSTSLMFSDAQSETVSLVPVGDEAYSAEQVTVIPQREGRLFLNVSAEIDTDTGMMARVMAIPIQVGSLRPASEQ